MKTDHEIFPTIILSHSSSNLKYEKQRLLGLCAGSPEPLMATYVICTLFSCAGLDIIE